MRGSFFLSGLLISLLSINHSNIFLIPGIAMLLLPLFIKDKEFNIYSGKFEIVNKSILPNLTVTEEFPFTAIKKLIFDNGFTNLPAAILAGIPDETFSKTDTLEVYTFDGKWRVIKRIGKKSEFRKAVELLIRQFHGNNLNN